MFYFQLGANCLWFSILDSTVFAYLLCKYLLLVIWNTRIRLCSRQNNGIVNFPVIWGDFGRRRLADDDVLSESDGDRDFYSCFPHPFPDGGRRCLLPIFLRTLSLSLSSPATSGFIQSEEETRRTELRVASQSTRTSSTPASIWFGRYLRRTDGLVNGLAANADSVCRRRR